MNSSLRFPFRRMAASALFGLAVTAGLVALAGVDQFADALGRFPVRILLAAAALSLANYALRFAKWHYFLRRLGIACPPGLSLKVFVAGMSMSISPGKFGEVAKSLLLKAELGTPVSRSAPVVLAERLTDLLGIVALCLAGLSTHPEAGRFAALGAACFAAGTAAVTTGYAPRLLARLLPGHAGKVTALFESARLLLAPAPLLFATLLSILSWFMECLGFWLVAGAVAGAVPLPAATYVYAVSTLAGALSMLPGGLAATEGGLAWLLTRQGATLADAGAATFVIRLLTLWLGVGLGLASLLAFFDVRRALATVKGRSEDGEGSAPAPPPEGRGPSGPPGSLSAVCLLLVVLAAPAFAADTKELRLVSTCPAVTEMIFHLGAGNRLVGVSSLCDYPPEARRIPPVADMTIDPERILAVSPDLVVVMKDLRAGETDRLAAYRLAVLELDLSSLDAVARSLDRLASLVGGAERARAFADRLAALRTAAAAAPTRPRVYVETWGQPPMTAGGGSFITNLVALAGGVNVFADRRQENLQVSAEEILAADPELVVLAYPEEPAVFARRAGLAALSAVRAGRVFALDPDLVVRPGPRLLDGAERLRGMMAGASEGLRPPTPPGVADPRTPGGLEGRGPSSGGEGVAPPR